MSKVGKKLISLGVILQLILSMFVFTGSVNAATVNRSRMLKTSGNKIVLADNPNTVVRLTGMNIPGGEWTGTPGVERITRSTKEAMENWNANLIRLPVSLNGWYGNYSYVTDGGVSYRNYMDSVIQMASEAGKYVVLDMHQYDIFNDAQRTFWIEAATKYANNPTVLFGILNEPKGVSWSVWRNGDGATKIGHQQIVETIRDLGAKNIIIAGGLDWGYDLRGIAGQASGDPTVYALTDQGSNNDITKSGNGIMYDTHIYPWKGRTANWDAAVGATRKLYPVLIGENGWDADDILSISGKTYNPGDPMYYDQWVPELFAWMNDEATYGNRANWTGWCFHPTSSPKILGDAANWKNDAVYAYPPTSYWGVYVKQQLKTDLGLNAALGKTVTSSGSDTGYAATNAVDDDNTTLWASSAAGDKYLSVDLGSNYDINRWLVRHAGTKTYAASANTKDFKLQVSSNGTTWTDIDVITGNTNNVTDRFIQPVTARYARLYVTQAAQADNNLKIYEFSVFGKQTVVPPPNLPTSVVGNVGQGTINNWYIAQDFEGATTSADFKTITAPNLASPGNGVTWYQNTTKTSSFYTVSAGDTVNTTKHIAGVRKSQIPIEMTAPAPVLQSGKLIYADMRIKRVSITDDPVTLKLMDSSSNEIFNVSFSASSIPQLITNQTYGTLTTDPAATVVKYPYNENWMYVRAIINFDTKTFELYQGSTLNSLAPFVNGTTTFSFKNANAANLNKIYTGSKGTLSFDDVNVYSVTSANAVEGNVGQGTISQKFVTQNFEGAASTSDPKVINAPNLANGDYILWSQTTTNTSNFYTVSAGDYVNQTKFINGVRKSQIPIQMTIDTHDANGTATAAPVTDSSKTIYADMRIKRVSITDDPVTLKLMDSSGNEILNVSFTASSIPQLNASQTYGTVTSNPAATVVTYPYSEDWVYIRAMINFQTKTFTLYQGATKDTMVPFVNGTTTFTFKNTNASNLYKIYAGYKGTISFDDVNIYSVIPQ